MEIADTSQERLDEFKKQLWKQGAIVFDEKIKGLKDCILAVVNRNSELKELAIQFDGPMEKIKALEGMRSKLYLVFMNEQGSFAVYGGKKSGLVDDTQTVEMFNIINDPDRFIPLSEEMERKLSAGDPSQARRGTLSDIHE